MEKTHGSGTGWLVFQVPGREREKLEGWVPQLASEDELRSALEQAFDYRGDITITRKDGSQLEGYLFDRRSGTAVTLRP